MKKFSLSSFAAGIFCTAAVLGLGTTAYAAYVNLNPSSTKLVVDGTAVNVTGYNVDNRNYFQLRELAKIFNMSLEWEAATDTAYMDSSKPYVEEVPAPVTTPPTSATAILANGKAVTEENILEILEELKIEYPDGTPWGDNTYYYSPVYGGGYGCAGWAFLVSDQIWGETAEYHYVKNMSEIRVGDILCYNPDTPQQHFVVVTELDENYYSACAAGGEVGVHWNAWGKISGTTSDAPIIYTRYPA